METKISNDCRDIGNRIFELCKAYNASGELTGEQVDELFKISTALTNEYMQLLNWLAQEQAAMHRWKTAWELAGPHIQQMNVEHEILVEYLKAKGLRQDYVDFAESMLAQMKLHAVEGGKDSK